MDRLENNKCSPPEELVAYLYGEGGDGVRDSIEQHLAGCDRCAGEFAELSFARLDVYEWHRDEFVEMATPRIVIPYAEMAVRSSWLDSLRGLFAWSGQWATAGAAVAAAALVVFGIWMFGSKPVDVAEMGGNNARVVPEKDRPAAPPTPEPVREQPAPIVEIQPQKIAARPFKTQTIRQPVKSDAGPTPKDRPVERPVQATQHAPRLNDFEDEDDTTLRLGDLLAEVDTREK